MKFQRMRPKSAAELKIPDLAGGLNLRDGLSEVLDNQLTDSVNVWWNEGLLKTRPGIETTKNMITYTGRPTEQTVSVRVFPEIKYTELMNNYVLQVVQRIWDINKDENYTSYLAFRWQGEQSSIDLPSIEYNGGTGYTDRYFVFVKDNFLYCFTEDRVIRKLNLKDGTEWEPVENEEIYAPLIVTGCKTDGSLVMTDGEILSNGTMIEGYNLIGNRYRMIYSAYNDEVAWGIEYDENNNVTKKGHVMIYSLLTNLSDSSLEGKTLTATLINGSGQKIEHTVKLNGSRASEEDFNKDDGFKMTVHAQVVTFCEEKNGEEKVAHITDKYNNENNLEFSIPYYATDEELDKVFQMTRCEWFGGGATGIAGGTRLFLCGNTKDKEKNLVVWSGLNNPLYFSENSYFYVGDNSSAVTGFGKQSNMLVIFKENETWYTQYQQNTSITAEDLINQNVIDYAASSVYFPLVQINSNIGCSYPDTVQLCRNRLVWLGNDSKVYTLVSENQYNERSIFCVSEMVERSLKKTWPLNSSACDWNGYYCLSIDDKLYLMDYNCYGYTHVASYSKTEDANIRIPWYCWELPLREKVFTLKDKMVFSYYHDGEAYGQCAIVSAVLSEDNGSKDSICQDDNSAGTLSIVAKDIKSSFTTKLFDFGQPHVRKNIERINLQLGNNGGAEINVRIITESGEEEHSITLLGNETKSYTPGYIDSKAIFPCIRQVLKVGLQFSSTGVIAIDGINFKYRTTGGAR